MKTLQLRSKYLKLPLLLVFASLVVSCNDDFLDEAPATNLEVSNFYIDLSRVNEALVGCYYQFGGPNDGSLGGTFNGYGNYFKGLLIFTEVGTDESYIDAGFWGRYFTDPHDKYTVDAQALLVEHIWRSMYRGISQANTILDRFPKDYTDEALANQYKGEAYFLRAFFYFHLAEFYGGVPLILHEANSPDKITFERAGAKETYEQIISDLQLAEELLPSVNYSGRATKEAAMAYQLNAYLQMSGYPCNDPEAPSKALAIGKKLEDLNNKTNRYILLPDYASVFSNDENAEILFSVTYVANNMGQGGQIGTWNSVPDYAYTRAYSFHIVPYEFARSFDTINDVRYQRNIANYTIIDANGTKKFTFDSTQIWCWKFRHDLKNLPSNEWQTGIDYPLMRWADVLLLNAEAECRANMGPTARAYDLINQVRARAHLQNLTPGLGYQQFMDALLMERGWELCFESKRFQDLVRFGKLQERVEFVKVSNPDAAANLSIPKHYLLPLPQHDINLSNGKLKQNDGYY